MTTVTTVWPRTRQTLVIPSQPPSWLKTSHIPLSSAVLLLLRILLHAVIVLVCLALTVYIILFDKYSPPRHPSWLAFHPIHRWTARALLWPFKLVQDGDNKSGTTVSKNSLLANTSASPFVHFFLKLEGRGEEMRGEESSDWRTEKSILPFVALVVSEERSSAFPWAHAEGLCGPRSKLSPCWKITTLHGRFKTLSTSPFAFLLPEANLTFYAKLAIANTIYSDKAP